MNEHNCSELWTMQSILHEHYDVLLGVNAAVIRVNTEEHMTKAIIFCSIFKSCFLHINFRIGMLFIQNNFGSGQEKEEL